MVIGFVGLGIMGKPMAKNLCRAGYTLIVNDHHKENVDELVQAGARSGDLKQIGMESDVVITMLPNSPQVKDVMLGENGIAGYMKKGTCFIDMSSINPVDSRYIGDVLKEKGITQQVLAEKLGVSYQSIKQTLNAPSVTTSTLEKIAVVLDVPIWQLFVSPEEVSKEQGTGLRCPNCGAKLELKKTED